MTKEKETLPEAGNPATTQPPQPNQPDTKFLIEMEYDMLGSSVTIRSKCPTVVLGGILRKAESVKPITIKEEGRVRRILIEYDLMTDEPIVKTDATDLVYRGMFVMAYSMMTQSQVLQRVQAVAASKIVRPS